MPSFLRGKYSGGQFHIFFRRLEDVLATSSKEQTTSEKRHCPLLVPCCLSLVSCCLFLAACRLSLSDSCCLSLVACSLTLAACYFLQAASCKRQAARDTATRTKRQGTSSHILFNVWLKSGFESKTRYSGRSTGFCETPCTPIPVLRNSGVPGFPRSRIYKASPHPPSMQRSGRPLNVVGGYLYPKPSNGDAFGPLNSPVSSRPWSRYPMGHLGLF